VNIDPADSWFSKCVRERAEWACERCRKQYEPGTMGLHCSHIFGRIHKATRWHPMNAVAHCYACHQYLGANPVEFRDWAIAHMGAERLEWVRKLHLSIYPTTAKLRKEIAAHYRKEHASLLERRLGGLTGRLEFEPFPGLQVYQPTTP
jgi:hypothetical protein